MIISIAVVCTENYVNKEVVFLKHINGYNGYKINIAHSTKF